MIQPILDVVLNIYWSKYAGRSAITQIILDVSKTISLDDYLQSITSTKQENLSQKLNKTYNKPGVTFP